MVLRTTTTTIPKSSSPFSNSICYTRTLVLLVGCLVVINLKNLLRLTTPYPDDLGHEVPWVTDDPSKEEDDPTDDPVRKPSSLAIAKKKTSGYYDEANTTTSATTTATATNLPTVPAYTKKTIRRWGCNRSETPLIFVHVGKAGGGQIRARLALAARDYHRSEWSNISGDNHFFPIRDTDSSNSSSYNATGAVQHRRGRFCNSRYGHANFIPEEGSLEPKKNFEGSHYCSATTPLGMAIACPSGFHVAHQRGFVSSLCSGCDDEYYLEIEYLKGVEIEDLAAVTKKVVDPPPPGHTCDIVYTSHNYVGNEISWLPPRYLKEHWWDNSPWKEERTTSGGSSSSSNAKALADELEPIWATLLHDRKDRKIQALHALKSAVSEEAASMAKQALEDTPEETIGTEDRWCPAGYQGIRVRGQSYNRPRYTNEKWNLNKDRFERCTEPIGKTVDRAFQELWNEHHPDDGSFNYSPLYASMPLHRATMLRDPWTWVMSRFHWDKMLVANNDCRDVTVPLYNDAENPGWIEFLSMDYLLQLCGNDCKTRLSKKKMSLAEIEYQVEDNLRNAFSVVGLLEDSDSFYEMIDHRIQYLDMKANTNEVPLLSRHESRPSENKEMCKELFLKNETFREMVRSTVPAFAAIERIYHVGAEVNKFQKKELEECG